MHAFLYNGHFHNSFECFNPVLNVSIQFIQFYKEFDPSTILQSSLNQIQLQFLIEPIEPTCPIFKTFVGTLSPTLVKISSHSHTNLNVRMITFYKYPYWSPENHHHRIKNLATMVIDNLSSILWWYVISANYFLVYFVLICIIFYKQLIQF